MIRDNLIPALKRHFPGREITFDAPPQPIAIFPSVQPQVGPVLLCDDGDEVTVLIENVTHSHFNAYDDELSEHERNELITQNVVDFLEALFSDRVLFFCSADKRSGGWTRLDLEKEPLKLSPFLQYYLWSRPYHP